MTCSLHETALRYANARRWSVFPLAPRTKIPLIGERDGGHGCLDATADLYEITLWWRHQPNANIGIATGPASGIFVLDVDVKVPKGGGIPGPQALKELERRFGELPATLTAGTGGGGEHRYFRWPEGYDLRNRATIKIDGVRTSLDSRAQGGYVAAPPSIHPDGGVYRWIGDAVDPADAPTWLLDLLAPVKATPGVYVPPVRPAAEGRLAAYGRNALDGACADIAGCGEGSRHDLIRNKALWIGRLIAGGCVGHGEAVTALQAAGEATGKDAREVAKCIAWGVDKGAGEPYRPPERDLAPRVVRAAQEWTETPPEGRFADEGAPEHGDEAPAPEDGPPVDESAPPDPTPNGVDRYRCSDVGNATRFHDRFGRDVRWCSATPGEGLLTWDGARWKADVMRKVGGLAQAVALDVVADAQAAWAEVQRLEDMASGKIPPEDPMTLASRTKAAKKRAKAVDGWAKSTEMSPRLKAMIEVALPGIALRHEDLDADQYLFNTATGTVDLRHGLLYPPRREDRITKIGGAAARPASTGCPLWIAFLMRIMGADKDPESEATKRAGEMVAFLQRCLGYSLTGSTKEQCMFILYGHGANGKSTFLDVVRAVWGEYGVHARAETFMRDARKSSIPNDIAALFGSRLITASEPEQGDQLNTSLMKEMTGDSAMTARFLNREFFTFMPTFKVFLATNHRPVIKDTGHGTWRRPILIPFTVTIPEGERDKDLTRKLMEEKDAILAWAVQGCGEWMFGDESIGRKPGLGVPAFVSEAIEDYRRDMDILAEFLAERCVVHVDERVTNTDIYKAFAGWQKDNGEQPRSHRWFTRALMDRGYKREDRRDLGCRWEGLGLRRDQRPVQGPPPRHPDDPFYQ